MSRELTYLCFLVAIYFLNSCTTLESQGDDHFEKGEFLTSVSFYEKALLKDPKDAEIKAKLTKARLMVIDRKLIEVRQHRMSGNWAEGLNVFSQIMEWERDWKIAPAGNVAFTQKEEFQYYNIEFANAIFRQLDNKVPFAAYFLFTTSQFLFDQSNKTASILGSIQSEGKKFCQKKYQSLDGTNYFYALLLSDRCGTIFSSTDKNAAKIAAKTSDHLYKNPIINLNAINMSVGSPESVRAQITDAFQNSAWFHANGKLTGSAKATSLIDINHRKWTTSHINVYYEDEKYIVYEDRMVDKRTPCAECAGGVRIQQSRQSLPIEKTRKVRREEPYSMFHHDATFKAEISGSIVLGSVIAPFNVSDNKSYSEKNDSRTTPGYPDISLSDDAFLLANLASLQKTVKSTLNAHYSAQFCQSIDNKNRSQLIENASKCGRAINQQSAGAVDPIMTQEFGIAYNILVEL